MCIRDRDKENSGEYDPTTYPVANSFTEFLGMLHISEDEMLGFGDDLRKELADPRVIEVPTGEGDRQELAERAARREEPAPQKLSLIPILKQEQYQHLATEGSSGYAVEEDASAVKTYAVKNIKEME